MSVECEEAGVQIGYGNTNAKRFIPYHEISMVEWEEKQRDNEYECAIQFHLKSMEGEVGILYSDKSLAQKRYQKVVDALNEKRGMTGLVTPLG